MCCCCIIIGGHLGWVGIWDVTTIKTTENILTVLLWHHHWSGHLGWLWWSHHLLCTIKNILEFEFHITHKTLMNANSLFPFLFWYFDSIWTGYARKKTFTSLVLLQKINRVGQNGGYKSTQYHRWRHLFSFNLKHKGTATPMAHIYPVFNLRF